MLLEEPYRPPLPDLAPEVLDRFAVIVSEPQWGWIDFTVVADADTIKFSPSYVWTDLETMKHWLEALARGEYPCVSLDAEGWWIYLMVTPSDTVDRVRFNITFAYTGVPTDRPTLSIWARPMRGDKTYDMVIERMCNAVLPRRQLVQAFYGALIDIWEKPDEETFWHMWFLQPTHWEECNWDDEEVTPLYFHIKSAIVDAYLAQRHSDASHHLE